MDNRASLHFFCGKAGAGKSTLAASVARESNALLLSEDVWMMRLFGDRLKTFEDYKVLAPKLRSVVGPLTTELLSSGQSVVLDFQANTKLGRAWFRSVFEPAAAGHTLHYLDVPDDICLKRIAKRNAERPEGSHHLTEQDFVYVSSLFQAPEPGEGFNVKRHHK